MEKGNDWQLFFKTINGSDVFETIINAKENMYLLLTCDRYSTLVYMIKTKEELDKHLDYLGPSAVVNGINIDETFRDLVTDAKQMTLERTENMYGDKLKKLETNEKFNKWKGEICGK